MALRFRKRVRIAPGISINITQKGITSTTVGPRGLNVNLGKKGKYLNAGLPGTGIYSRTQIAAAKKANSGQQKPLRAVSATKEPTKKSEPGLKEAMISIILIALIFFIAINIF